MGKAQFAPGVHLAGQYGDGLGVDEVGALTFGLSNANNFYAGDNGEVIFDDGSEESSIANTNSSTILNIYIGRESRVFDFKVSNDVVNENFALLGFIISYETKDFQVFRGEDTYLTDNSGVV